MGSGVVPVVAPSAPAGTRRVVAGESLRIDSGRAKG